jgi:glycerol-3-phosphate acyltransferase PlsY
MLYFYLSLLVIASCLFTYFFSNVLYASILGKIFCNKDIRQEGSHNPGATNLLRVTKKKYLGIVATLLDALKGYISVTICAVCLGIYMKHYNLRSDVYYVSFICSVFAVLGHCFPLLYIIKLLKKESQEELSKVNGGKGVSTYGGVIFAISPYIGIIALGLWFIISYISKYVSLSSIICALIAAPLVFVPQLWVSTSYYGTGVNYCDYEEIVSLVTIYAYIQLTSAIVV